MTSLPAMAVPAIAVPAFADGSVADTGSVADVPVSLLRAVSGPDINPLYRISAADILHRFLRDDMKFYDQAGPELGRILAYAPQIQIPDLNTMAGLFMQYMGTVPDMSALAEIGTPDLSGLYTGYGMSVAVESGLNAAMNTAVLEFGHQSLNQRLGQFGQVYKQGQVFRPLEGNPAGVVAGGAAVTAAGVAIGGMAVNIGTGATTFAASMAAAALGTGGLALVVIGLAIIAVGVKQSLEK